MLAGTVKCNKCDENIGKYEEHATCEGVCKGKYHFTCSIEENNYRKIANSTTKTWQCQQCTNQPSIITRQKSKETKTDYEKETKQEMKEIKKLLSEMSFRLNDLPLIKTDMEEMKKSSNFISDQYESFKNQLNENNKLISTLLSSLEKMKIENSQKDKKIEDLNLRISRLEQQSKTSYLEICEMQEDKNITCIEQVIDISNEAQINVKPEDIKEAYRMPKRENSRMKHRPLIVNFHNKCKRDEFVKKRQLHLRKEQQEIKVYFNELMTPFYKNLLYICKQRARDTNHRFVWFANGKILVRKKESSPVITIETEGELSKLQ